MNKKHTQKSKNKMSEIKKAWWEKLRQNPKKLAEVKENIGKSSRGKIRPSGEKSSGWKGGRYTTKRDGYVYLYAPNHPFSKKNGRGGGGYVLEHRLVMEKVLGRYLTKEEDIHHKNGIKNDNRVENLMLISHNQHYEGHTCPKCNFEFFTQ